MRLENKVALISGGARGMGAAEARLFAREGAKVVIGDVLEEDGHQTEAQINESGRECLFVRLDVTSEANWQEAVATTVARFGKLDILVNNAGIYPPALIEDTTEELWDRIMDINGKGVFLGTKCAIPEEIVLFVPSYPLTTLNLAAANVPVVLPKPNAEFKNCKASAPLSKSEI